MARATSKAEKADGTDRTERETSAAALRSLRRTGVLGFETADTKSLVQRLDAGFPFRVVVRLQQALGMSLDALAPLVGIPARTLARRKLEGRLRPEESERVLRIARVFDLAAALFEHDLASANIWLREPKKALGGEAPLQFARTEVGAREVEHLIGRLEHGVLS
jgi:putative toxin-antitoxin system antitoxin component (TIGR02293 family)